MTRLSPLIRKHSKIGMKNCLLIYKIFIRPILTYASPVWGGAFMTNIKKVQVSQYKVLRNILNAPRYTTNALVHSDLQVDYIKDYIL